MTPLANPRKCVKPKRSRENIDELGENYIA